MSWNIVLWFAAGWVISGGIFYLLKYLNPDRGICLHESAMLLDEQIQYGFGLNYSNVHGECLFSDDYNSAKAKFIHFATEAGAEITDLPIESSSFLSQTAALFQGDPRKVFVHLSGVHGVEGYAGSAIQHGALRYLANSGLYRGNEGKKDLPTLIFIHAVNPYGFYYNRRTNEDNIDLNRNFLTDDEFNFVKKRDPNYSRYVELDSVLNPTKMPFANPYLNDVYWLFNAAKYIYTFGFVAIKRAMVAGNYHKQKGYGFGGFQRSTSANNIIDYLKQHQIDKKSKIFYLLDVHTGLGPTGVDTLMFDHVDDTAWAESVFPTQVNQKGSVIGGIKSFSFGTTTPVAKATPEKDKKKIAATTKDAETVSSGYELTVGTTHALCQTFIASHLHGKDRLCIAQEFGTVPAIYVGKGSMEENYAHWYGNEREKAVYKARYRPLFYVETREWKRRIVSRGLLTFQQAFNYLKNISVE